MLITSKKRTTRPPICPKPSRAPAQGNFPPQTTHSDHFDCQLQWIAQAIQSLPLLPLPSQERPSAPIYYLAQKTAPAYLEVANSAPLYLTKHTLGQGTFGKVNLAIYQQQWVAVKKISHKTLSSHESTNGQHPLLHLTAALHEAQKLHLGSSPLTPKIVYYTPKKAYLLEPLMLGDFWDFCTSPRYLYRQAHIPYQAGALAICLLEGVIPCLQKLHRQRLAHLDIKPNNILYRGDTITLADYGAVADCLAVNRDSSLIAPEHLHENRPYWQRDNRQIDIWCLGFSALWLASHIYSQTYFSALHQSSEQQKTFFHVYKQAHQFNTNPVFPTIDFCYNSLLSKISLMFAHVESSLQPLLVAMCHPDPEQRPRIDSIARRLQHLKQYYGPAIGEAQSYLRYRSIQQFRALPLTGSLATASLSAPSKQTTEMSNTSVPSKSIKRALQSR